jgi:ADP-ribosylglycohydrolase
MTTPGPARARDGVPPRPVDETYWVLPGRLLVGAHPGSRSRAQAMDRLRRFLEAGVTCFIDLTEPEETPAYEGLLPFETPTGRRVEYLREPIVDHGVPASRDTMARVLAMLDGALESGHLVYLHCRAGIGRSAMAAGCWLAERSGSGEGALGELAAVWPQARQSQYWPSIPETAEQAEFVRQWVQGGTAARGTRRTSRRDAAAGTAGAAVDVAQRIAGAWYGLALGDALGAAHARGERADAHSPLRWTQHTALALCLAESLLELGRGDARDQIERYVHWQREGQGERMGRDADSVVSPDVAKALATYRWRGLPMAGPHDPRDLAASSLPRVLAAATYAWREPATAVALGAEAARTTHQSPVILEACRVQAATLVAALQGQPAAHWLDDGVPDTEPSAWAGKPLRADVRGVLEGAATAEPHLANGPVLQAYSTARRIVRDAGSFDAALNAACRAGRREAALYSALAGSLHGVRHGLDGLPVDARQRLADAAQLDAVVTRLLEHDRRLQVPA